MYWRAQSRAGFCSRPDPERGWSGIATLGSFPGARYFTTMIIPSIGLSQARRTESRAARLVGLAPVIVAIMLVLLALLVPPALAAQSTGTITGRVVSAATREAIPGVVVRLPASASGEVLAALSDSLGLFVLRNVPVGVTRLEVRRN